jgi:hypothetical protein
VDDNLTYVIIIISHPRTTWDSKDVIYTLSESFAFALFALSISAHRKTRINTLLGEVKDFGVLTNNPLNKFLVCRALSV